VRRRDAIQLFATAGVLAETACRTNVKKTMAPNPSPEQSRMPVLFVAHGAPVLMDDAGWVSELHAWAGALPKPKSILMISAHWEKRPATYGATTTVPLFYDFYGFPAHYYEVKYPAPGAPELARRVSDLLGARGTPVAQKPERGLDHGAYVPLLCMFPEANVPVLQLSLPSLDPKELHAFGRALSPLRDEGVLIIGSGFLTHNMRFAFRPGTPQWATEFDQWAEQTLAKRDDDALVNFMSRAPAAAMALPTTEHFVPVIVAAGAAEGSTKVSFPITGFWGAAGGAFTRRSVELA
jgi:4,5-DOPA dioxygenase extradiol